MGREWRSLPRWARIAYTVSLPMFATGAFWLVVTTVTLPAPPYWLTIPASVQTGVGGALLVALYRRFRFFWGLGS